MPAGSGLVSLGINLRRTLLWAVASAVPIAASILLIPDIRGIFGGGLGLLMVAMAAADARDYVIPDGLTLLELVLGVMSAIAGPSFPGASHRLSVPSRTRRFRTWRRQASGHLWPLARLVYDSDRSRNRGPLRAVRLLCTAVPFAKTRPRNREIALRRFFHPGDLVGVADRSLTAFAAVKFCATVMSPGRAQRERADDANVHLGNRSCVCLGGDFVGASRACRTVRRTNRTWSHCRAGYRKSVVPR
jgi:hypothetical protein